VIVQVKVAPRESVAVTWTPVRTIDVAGAVYVTGDPVVELNVPAVAVHL